MPLHALGSSRTGASAPRLLSLLALALHLQPCAGSSNELNASAASAAAPLSLTMATREAAWLSTLFTPAYVAPNCIDGDYSTICASGWGDNSSN